MTPDDKKIAEVLNRYYLNKDKIIILKKQQSYYSKSGQIDKANNAKNLIEKAYYESKIVNRAIEDFSEKEKEFLELRYRKKYTYNQIYENVFIPERTCVRLNKRIINHVRNYVE